MAPQYADTNDMAKLFWDRIAVVVAVLSVIATVGLHHTH